MDDSCAVCADTLEWVAYGSCGHKEVCSTCVARLRFICNDRRCCICKSDSTVIFVTKALGDYTKMISDFSVFPSEAKEGRSGSYWYHEDTQAYFDDLDHYKMIKAMCRLSCSVCDKMDDHPSNGSKRKARFRNIEQLKGHLFHQHRLFMCSLCLEGRKVFICEQKLYNRAQLKQHINTGDSEVDGTESERGGFKGHPLCEFCRSPYYGDNELYTHMSTEHYTCHICQRQHPGQYEYYKNYDDLEIHFRQEHFLCEDEGCLAKKFVVFQSEAEMKRHNTMEHGGRMSRSKRNAALQLPTSFRYRRSNEQDNRRGRGRTFQRDLSEDELSRAIEASFETANVNARYPESSSSSVPGVSGHDNSNNVDPLIQPFESLGTDSEPPSRYLQAVSHHPRHGPLEESSFPPLSTGPSGSMQRPPNDHEGLSRNTMAENLRRQNKKKVNVLNAGQTTAQAWPAASRLHNASSSMVPSRAPNYTQGLSVGSVFSSRPSSVQTQTSSVPTAFSSRPSSVQAQTSSIREPPSIASITSTSRNNTSRIGHSSSAPNLVDAGSMSDFPPVSALQTRNPPSGGQSVKNVEDVHAANKSMVEKIRAGLDYDQDKFAIFKDISAEYRQGNIDAGTYLVYVEQYGLSHLVPELARLCPDPRKEKELIAVYNANQTISGPLGNDRMNGFNSKGKSMVVGNSSNGANNKGKSGVAGDNGKGKSMVAGSNSKDKLADSILSTVRELQSNYKNSEEEVEILSKDGYRVTGKGKSTLLVDGSHTNRTSPSSQLLLKPKSESGDDGGGSNSVRSKQQKKKTSKFHRVRLGSDSMASILDLNNSSGPDSTAAEVASDGNKDQPSEGLPVRGVWRNGGGQRLLSKTPRKP